MRLNRVPLISYLGNEFAHVLLKLSNQEVSDHQEMKELYDNKRLSPLGLTTIDIEIWGEGDGNGVARSYVGNGVQRGVGFTILEKTEEFLYHVVPHLHGASTYLSSSSSKDCRRTHGRAVTIDDRRREKYQSLSVFINVNPNSQSSVFDVRSSTGHSNIKLFMYQGGLQSTQEAIHHAVPVLGFPILSDQEFQLRKLKSLGAGNHLNLGDLTTDKLESTILEIIHNK
ncbi:unnamed protein product, partial [Heterotrigona itama]